jgi:hypothetical protein
MVAASIPVRYNSILPRKKEHATKRSIALLLAEDAPFDTGIFAVLGEPMNTLRCWPARSGFRRQGLTRWLGTEAGRYIIDAWRATC